MKKMAAISAEANFEAVSRVFTAASGMGMRKRRKPIGNARAAITCLPRKRNPPAAMKETNASAMREKESF